MNIVDREFRLPPVLQQAVEDAFRFSEALYQVHPKQCGPHLRDNFGTIYLSICLDHREAAILLVRHGAFSSAHALTRAIYESCVRGLWARFAASEAQLVRLRDRGISPTFETVGKELAEHDDMGMLARLRKDVWGPLSDFAHSGKRQIDEWFSEGQIGAQHDPVRLANTLLLNDVYGQFALEGLLACAGLDREPAMLIAQRLLAPRIAALAPDKEGPAATFL